MRGRIPSTELGRRRVAAGLTRNDIATQAECAVSTVSYFETHPAAQYSPAPVCQALGRIYAAMNSLEPEQYLQQWMKCQVVTYIKEHEQVIPIEAVDYLCELGMLLIRARRYQLAYGQELNPGPGHRGKE